MSRSAKAHPVLQSADPTFYGGVAHTYRMARYEVTAGQYTEFLNAVAAADTYNLYHARMDYDADPTRNGCNIKRQGAPGSFTYSVAADWADRPVNWVSWADAVRFANWLHNGQPSGAQDLSTTEDGSYFINGIHESNDGLLEAVVREPDATWVIPTDDEWYKAAYHKNDGVTGNYWNFPTGTDSFALSSNDLVDPDPGHHATYRIASDFTVGAPYWRTEVGAHENTIPLHRRLPFRRQPDDRRPLQLAAEKIRQIKICRLHIAADQCLLLLLAGRIRQLDDFHINAVRLNFADR